MAVLSVPLRGAEVERVPLWGLLFWKVGARSVARVFFSRNCDWVSGEDIRELALFSEGNSTRAFLPIQPSIQVGCAETPHFSYMGAVNLPASSQLL